MRATRGEWPEDLARASIDLLPETEDWAIRFDPETGHSVVATDGNALCIVPMATPST